MNLRDRRVTNCVSSMSCDTTSLTLTRCTTRINFNKQTYAYTNNTRALTGGGARRRLAREEPFGVDVADDDSEAGAGVVDLLLCERRCCRLRDILRVSSRAVSHAGKINTFNSKKFPSTNVKYTRKTHPTSLDSIRGRRLRHRPHSHSHATASCNLLYIYFFKKERERGVVF